MSFLKGLIKSVVISLFVFLCSSFSIINSANAKNITGGFGTGTMITTPDGNMTIEDLQPGDRIIGYNFKAHQNEENIVEQIKRKSSLSYYLINNKTKITGGNLLYIKTHTNPKLVGLQQLKLNHKLFAQNHFSINVESVRQIVQPTDVYQVVLDNPEGNLFADNFLVHVGNKVPALFKRQYINCDPGTPYFKSCANVNSDTFPGFAKAVVILMLGIVSVGTLIFKLIIYIPNLVRFSGKSFADDVQIIDFTKSVNHKFTNLYSIKYLQGYKVWYLIPLKPEIEETSYQHLIAKTDLIELINNLYSQYHQDLITKNFADIRQYFPKFSTKQEYRDYQKYFTNNFDIIYLPKIIEMNVIGFEAEANIFRVQINAEMINFAISASGYVLTGESQTQKYSEYWDIEVITNHEYYINDISDTVATQILQGDLQAKREAYKISGA